MQWLYGRIHELFQMSPELALFLCLALGYRLGKVTFGKFQLGGVAGSLLVAVVISQFGVTPDSGLKNVLFALFIYAVGYESGPQFFQSLNRESLREIFLAGCLALSGLVTVIVLAKLFHLDKGLAAGIAAGALTQSAIIGTAGDAIAKLDFGADQVKTLQQNVAIGYAVTYIFGSLGAIIVCVNILPQFMGKSIHDDAIAAEAGLNSSLDILGPDEEYALQKVVGRVFRLVPGYAGTVSQLEGNALDGPVTVEKAKRDGKILHLAPDLTLQGGDEVLLVGSRQALVKADGALGEEVYGDDDMELHLLRQNVVLTRGAFHKQPALSVRDMLKQESIHGVYVLALYREGKPASINRDTQLRAGDVITLFGSGSDVARATAKLGHPIQQSSKTDFIYLGIGMVAGFLIGMVTVRVAGLPLTLGSGGGALLAGLLFGWFRTRRPEIGYMPPGAIQLLKDLGLAGFVAIVGLASGLEAVNTIKQSGLTIFMVGVLVTVIPLLITMVVGRYVIGYKNTAILAGALSGSRSANPAFGEVLNKAGNSVPTVPFAITYALANVFLTLLGPLVVSLA